jgi:hypothetical protein
MLSVVYFIYSLTSLLFKFVAHFCFVYITELCDRVMRNIIELFLFNWFPDSFVVALHLFLLIYLVFLLCSLSVVMVWVVWSCPLSVVVVLVVWSLEYCTFSSSFFSIFSYGFFDFSFACSPDRADWTVKVQIVRLWLIKSQLIPDNIISMNFILLDYEVFPLFYFCWQLGCSD